MTKLNISLLLFVLLVVQAHADWPRWRGPSDTGSIAEGHYPAALGQRETLWKTPLPGKGCSTPIVSEDTIFVTAPSHGKDALVAIGLDGKVKWTTVFGMENAGKHRNGSGSNASPATDGETVFVYFKSGTLAAVDRGGDVRWQTNLVDRFGKDTLYWDHGTTPVLTDKHVIMARMHEGESWLAAFEKQTGKMDWKVPRNYETPQEGDHGYTTPLVIDHQGQQAILLWGAQHVTIHDPKDGRVQWECGNFNPDSERLWPAIATPVIVNDVAVICFGRNDRGKPRLHGVRLDGSGNVTASNHVWQRDDISSFVPSPIAFGGRVYLLRDKGQLECVDPSNGDILWSHALPKNRNAYYASPLIAGDKFYAAREDGVVFVGQISQHGFEQLSENDMGESVIGSPVPFANRILIRGEKHLFCLAEPEKLQ